MITQVQRGEHLHKEEVSDTSPQALLIYTMKQASQKGRHLSIPKSAAIAYPKKGGTCLSQKAITAWIVSIAFPAQHLVAPTTHCMLC